MRGAHHARCKRPGSAGVPPASRLRGHGDGLLPHPPRWGREPGASPQRGEAGRGAEPCARWSPQPSMRLAPHPDGMNIRLFLGGRSPPKPSRGWGNGETRFPHAPAQGRRPYLPAGGGVGKPGFPTPLGPIFTLGNDTSFRPQRQTARLSKCSQFSWERGQLARGAATRAGRPRSQARGVPQVRTLTR